MLSKHSGDIVAGRRRWTGSLKIPGDELGGSDYLRAGSAEDVVGVGGCFLLFFFELC